MTDDEIRITFATTILSFFMLKPRTVCRVSGLLCGLFLGGGCSSGPSLELAREWVHTEVPPGASKPDVQRFCQRHQFQYSQDTPSQGWARLKRRFLLLFPDDIVARIAYDDAGRVQSTEVNFDNLLP